MSWTLIVEMRYLQAFYIQLSHSSALVILLYGSLTFWRTLPENSSWPNFESCMSFSLSSARVLSTFYQYSLQKKVKNVNSTRKDLLRNVTVGIYEKVVRELSQGVLSYDIAKRLWKYLFFSICEHLWGAPLTRHQCNLKHFCRLETELTTDD